MRLARHEAEVSLLALQLLLAHAELALRPVGSEGEMAISPRKVVLAIRSEMVVVKRSQAKAGRQ